MDPEFQIRNNAGTKELLLRKLSYAVISSVVIQIVLLTIFLVFINLDVLNPTKWMAKSFATLTSFTTWFFLVPFLSVVLAQSLICAKDYVLRTTCSSTRIGCLISIFSTRNFVLLLLHVLTGGFFVWLFFALSDPGRRLFVKCEQHGYCLNEDCFCLVLFGAWIGLYYFIWIYTVDKTIIFPVIQQKKLFRFQSNLIPIFKNSQKDSIFPVGLYLIIYYFYGGKAQDFIKQFFTKQPDALSPANIYTLFYIYLFATLYIFNMKLVRFFFEIFLTEPNQFPIVSVNNGDLILKDAIDINYIPIIQHLACLDLHLLSINSKSRRQQIFSLSQPGNHPHNWNFLVQNVLKMLNEYTQSMNNSIVTILTAEQEKKDEQVQVQTPNRFVKNYNFGNMRNMTLTNLNVPVEFVTITQETPQVEKIESFQNELRNKWKSIIFTIKRRTGINYLFEELPARNIQFLLSNGQIIVWTVQGLSSLTVASLTEDQFGVMQKDLPVILSTLIELRQSIEKLNRLPALTRKSQKFDDYSNKMKTNINSAVKRSLYHICNKFGPYLKDLPISNEVLQFLHVYGHQ